MCRLGLLLLLLASPLCPSSWPPPDTPEGRAATAGLILSVLERATGFLEKRLPQINLDGVLGFRVLEVQLKGVQEEWDQNPQLQPLSLRVEKLARRLTPLLHRSVLYLKLSDPQYLREFQPTIQPGFWKLPHVWTHTNASMVYPTVEPQDSFSEEHSDLCLAQLLGTGTEGSQPCSLSDVCRTLMTTRGCSGYCLSHQLLFFLVAGMKGCTRGIFHQSQGYMNLFCANMMDLNQRAEAIGYAYPTQDIFMENIMLCGIGGFSDFYKLRWLEAILSWQKQEGCFGVPDTEDEELSKDIRHQQHYLRRVKRREKQFADGCSSHSTAMAVAALGGFLYVLARGELQQAPSAPPTAPDMDGSLPATHQESFTPSFLKSWVTP